MTEFQGVLADAITPRGPQGDVDLGASFELIDYLCGAGLRGIVLFADAGEYPAFHAEERCRLTYLAVKRSRIPVLAGVGSATIDISIGLAREARDAGAAGVLLPPPFFSRFEPEDLREFYLQFARQVAPDLAVFLLNTPTMQGGLELETALELEATGLFAGIVDSHGAVDSLVRMQSAANGAPFQVLTGSDANFAAARLAGVAGAISEAACAAPELLLAIDRAVNAGQPDRVEALDRELGTLLSWIGRFPTSTAIRVAAGLRGLKTGPLTVPLSAPKQQLLEEFRQWFTGWLPAVKRLCATP